MADRLTLVLNAGRIEQLQAADVLAPRSWSINNLDAAAIAAGDSVPFWDITATAANKKITFANFEAALNHNALTNYVAAEHINWSNASSNLSTTGYGAFTAGVAVGGATLGDDALAVAGAPSSDDGAHGLTVSFLPTSDGTAVANYGLYFAVRAGVDAGQSNTGTAAAVRGSCYTDGSLAAGATQRRLAGYWLEYGPRTGTAGTVTYNYGILLQPYHQAGTVVVNYDILINAPNAGGSVTNDWAIYCSHDAPSYLVGELGLGQNAPDARFEVQTAADEGKQAITIDQDDADKAFIDYQGTSSADAANNISTWTTAAIAGYVKVEINGAEQWMAYYNAPTGP